MLTVGITGGVGSGKTVVCNIFKQFGVVVFDADAVAKKLYDVPEVIMAVKQEFGEKYFNSGGELDKKKFAELVFNDPVALKKINKIIHPFVKKRFSAWKKQQAAVGSGSRQDCLLALPTAYFLKEAAILFESGSDKGCDKIITVTAPVELRIQRVLDRDHRSREQVEKIISRQWTDEEKIKRSDFVIVNDEKKLILPQVLKIHQQLVLAATSNLKLHTSN
jgi:dephospho-CoA kinase